MATYNNLTTPRTAPGSAEEAARQQAIDLAMISPKTAPTPTTPTTTPAPATSVRNPSLYEKALSERTAATKTYQDQLDQVKIYAAQQRQARIDAINTAFAPRIAREEKAGAERMQRVKALTFKSGITGSGVDTTKLGEQSNLNEKALQDIEASKAIAIQEAFDKADALAVSMANQAYDRSLKTAEANLEQEKFKYNNALDAIKTFGAGGTSLEALKTSEPETYRTLQEASGLSDLQIASMLNSSSPQPSNVDTVIKNGYIISSYFDPKLKKFTHITEKLPEGVSDADLEIMNGANGIIYALNKTTGKVVNKVDASKPASMTESQKTTLASYLNEVPTYKSREEALNELGKYESAIKVQVGDTGFNQIISEIDKQFPAPKEITSQTASQSAIEKEIETMKKRYPNFNEADIRHSLRSKGFSEQDVISSSVGGTVNKVLDSLESFLFSNRPK